MCHTCTFGSEPSNPNNIDTKIALTRILRKNTKPKPNSSYQCLKRCWVIKGTQTESGLALKKVCCIVIFFICFLQFFLQLMQRTLLLLYLLGRHFHSVSCCFQFSQLLFFISPYCYRKMNFRFADTHKPKIISLAVTYRCKEQTSNANLDNMKKRR